MILQNGRLIDGTGRVFERSRIVVEGGKIVAVSAEWVGNDASTNVIDLKGRTVVPGLINCHIHLCMNAGADPMTEWNSHSLTENVLVAASQAEEMLWSGITTARDLGGHDGVDIGLKKAIERGLIQGPRLLVSGRVLTMTGGHCYPKGREVDGPDEVRKGAREQIKAGADVIKVMATGGVLTFGTEPGSAQLTVEEMATAVEEAHKAGRKVAAHAQGAQGIINAARAGVDSIEHGFYLTEESIELMLQRNVTFVPTIAATHWVTECGREIGVPAFIVDKARRGYDAQWQSLQRAHAAGVVIAAGNDGGCPLSAHKDIATELELLVKAGLTPSQALSAATVTAARLLGLESEIGTVEPGKDADLVVLARDPWADISAVREVDMVIRRGQIVHRASYS